MSLATGCGRQLPPPSSAQGQIACFARLPLFRATEANNALVLTAPVGYDPRGGGANPMDELPITIVGRNGSRFVESRPIRRSASFFGIEYRNKRWPVGPDLSVDLRTTTPLPDDGPWEAVDKADLQRLLSCATENPQPALVSAETITPLASPIPAASPVQTVRVSPESFDKSQQAIIEAAADARILVNAGPGTGKTAVICERVRYLVEQRATAAARICLISFTRTAVQEIRLRVAAALGRRTGNSVQMATLDSLAGQLNRSMGGQPPTSTFDDNIRRLIDNLESSDAVADYVDGLQHVFIDEAQDIVGVRAMLLVSLINRLPAECGVTILSDDAQAIYGFAANDDRAVESGKKNGQFVLSLPATLRAQDPPSGFTPMCLDTIHRTSDENLKKIFSDLRAVLLSDAEPARSRHEKVRSGIEQLAHGKAPADSVELAEQLSPDAFLLFRRRVEAIVTSQWLTKSNVPHRLRMSGLPLSVEPWIAATLGEFTESRIGLADFTTLWQESVASTSLATTRPDVAFEVLRRFASDKSGKLIDLERLRSLLATRPPLTVTRAELGSRGPIVGTIHACKGREAGDVALFLPEGPEDADEERSVEEEARILFVGATRACNRLLVGNGLHVRASQVGNGRTIRLRAKGKFKSGGMEVGRAGDLTPLSFADRTLFTPSDVKANQREWRALADARASVSAFKRPLNGRWAFLLREQHGRTPLGALNPSVGYDLGTLMDFATKFPGFSGSKRPALLSNLRVIGMTTYALSAEDPMLGQLPEPWRSSRLVLGPLLYGFSWFTLKGN